MRRNSICGTKKKMRYIVLLLWRRKKALFGLAVTWLVVTNGFLCIQKKKLPRATPQPERLSQLSSLHVFVYQQRRGECVSSGCRIFDVFYAVPCRSFHPTAGRLSYSMRRMWLGPVGTRFIAQFTCYSRFSSTCVATTADFPTLVNPSGTGWRSCCRESVSLQQPCTNSSTEVVAFLYLYSTFY